MEREKIAKYLSEDPAGPRCRSLRPDDLAGLVAGVKSVIYTSVTGAEDAAAMDALCADLGLKKVVLGRKTRVDGNRSNVDILIGTDTRKLRAAERSYARLIGTEWGLALGYPECCVQAYVNWRNSRRRGDLVASIAANSPKGRPFSFLTNNVCNYYSLLFRPGDPKRYAALLAANPDFDLGPVIPWHPCSYSCPRSLAAGLGIYRVLVHYMPTFAAGRRAQLSKPVLFWDKFRFAVLNGTASAGPEGGLTVDCRGVAGPRTLLARGTVDELDRRSVLRFGRSGKLYGPGAPALPPGYALLPFS